MKKLILGIASALAMSAPAMAFHPWDIGNMSNDDMVTIKNYMGDVHSMYMAVSCSGQGLVRITVTGQRGNVGHRQLCFTPIPNTDVGPGPYTYRVGGQLRPVNPVPSPRKACTFQMESRGECRVGEPNNSPHNGNW